MNFPEKTVLNKIMPKAKFVNKVELSTNLRNEFNTNVDKLILANILRKDTLNIESGKFVEEIDVLDFFLKEKSLSDNLIKEIDSSIPRQIVYCLRFKDEAQIVVSYKEKNIRNDKCKVFKLYRTEWLLYSNIQLCIKGLNLDEVFENFIVQIAGDILELNEKMKLKEVVEKSIDIEKLQKKIIALENKINNEKQFNKQLELKKELKVLKEQMEDING